MGMDRGRGSWVKEVVKSGEVLMGERGETAKVGEEEEGH